MHPNPSLYDLTSDIIDLFEALQSEDQDVRERAIAAMAITSENYKEKMETYVRLIEYLEHIEGVAKDREKRLKAEAEVYKDRAQVQRNKIDSLKIRIKESFQAIGLQSVETTVGTLRVQANPPKLEIESEENIQPWFYTEETIKKLDKKALTAYIIKRATEPDPETGEVDRDPVPGVRVVRETRVQVYR